MSDKLARDIEILAELFKAGGWQEVRIQSDEISLLLSNDPDCGSIGGHSAAPPLEPTISSIPFPAGTTAAPPAPAGQAIAVGADPSWTPVKAPNLGTFYRSPKPGSPTFVEVGQHVEADTEVCLIEVMKLFTSVKAGVAGTVKSIAAADAALVEGGQVLLYIQQD